MGKSKLTYGRHRKKKGGCKGYVLHCSAIGLDKGKRENLPKKRGCPRETCNGKRECSPWSLDMKRTKISTRVLGTTGCFQMASKEVEPLHSAEENVVERGGT